MTVLYAAHGLRKLDRHGAELVRKKFQERSTNAPLSLRDAGKAFWRRWQAKEATGSAGVLRLGSWRSNTPR